MQSAIDLKSIKAHNGDIRGAFEELSCLLFLRKYSEHGLPMRREGAGGDGGLEISITDSKNRVVICLQAKFFNKAFSTSQWNQLDDSIRTIINNNTTDSCIRKIIVTIPRNLTESQEKKWADYKSEWNVFSDKKEYKANIEFILWDESTLRNMLLEEDNRGLLLHYFYHLDFDLEHLQKKTISSLQNLGDRHNSSLHAETETELEIHKFLRSEYSRIEFLKATKETFKDHRFLSVPPKTWPTGASDSYVNCQKSWELLRSQLGDGMSLPQSFKQLSLSVEKYIQDIATLLEIGENFVLNETKENTRADTMYRSRTPDEDILNNYEKIIWSLKDYKDFTVQNHFCENPCLLIKGEPGTGKTHLLAEICSQYSQQGGVVIFVESCKFVANEMPLEQFKKWIDFPGTTTRDLFLTIDAVSSSHDMPVLICIDALNETPNRNIWRTGLTDFSDEISNTKNVKLLVSCRTDYLAQTIPDSIRNQKSSTWSIKEHLGLGINILEAFPKYIKAYNITWNGLPPLTSEFRNPLFLRIFCETFKNDKVDPSSLSIYSILKKYVAVKAKNIAQAIDCNPNSVNKCLSQIAKLMSAKCSLLVPDEEIQNICYQNHQTPTHSSSLYVALISEGILAEFPNKDGLLDSTNLIRFTYERIWDYFLSINLIRDFDSISEQALSVISDPQWIYDNSGVFSILQIRFAEDERGELIDLLPDSIPTSFKNSIFFNTLYWRTPSSSSERTHEILNDIQKDWDYDQLFAFYLRTAPNPNNPWNALDLHEYLLNFDLSERDRAWTWWLNAHFAALEINSPLLELIIWAEQAPRELLHDDDRLLIAITLAWASSTTHIKERGRLTIALCNLIADSMTVAYQLFEKFTTVDDPYVLEIVLLASLGAIQHSEAPCSNGKNLVSAIHKKFFSKPDVPPHILIRHYASEICIQGNEYGLLAADICTKSFLPPYKSKWPEIWDQKKCEHHKTDKASQLYHSVMPNTRSDFGYGNWGRYTMQYHVQSFSLATLNEAVDSKGIKLFDAELSMRYVLQRVYEIGWDPEKPDKLPYYGMNHGPKIERLSKKYQWQALYELLGYLADNHHFIDYDDKPIPFTNARQLVEHTILDPFINEAQSQIKTRELLFQKKLQPWWSGGFTVFPFPLSIREQHASAVDINFFDPREFLDTELEQNRWLTLSAYHRINEPRPAWEGYREEAHLSYEISIQSYIVPTNRLSKLKKFLNQAMFDHNSRFWLTEPEFAQEMSNLKNYPENQDPLKKRCLLDELRLRQIIPLNTKSYSSTCRCSPDAEKDRAKAGSIPSPQLAEICELSWNRENYDFKKENGSDVVFQNNSLNNLTACSIEANSLIEALKRNKLKLVWRVFIQKYLHASPIGSGGSRAYWATFSLTPKGKILSTGGATSSYNGSRSKDEDLPWK